MSCPECGAPYEYQKKWNSGNPAMIEFPTCTCEEENTERRLDEMLENLQRRQAGDHDE